MLKGPRRGDVVLSGDTSSGFRMIDAVTGTSIHGPVRTLGDAIEFCRREHPTASIWQLSVDDRGRQLGDPVRLLEFKHAPR